MGKWIGGQWYAGDDVPQYTCPHCSGQNISFVKLEKDSAIQCNTCGCIKKASEEYNDMFSYTREWETKKWVHVLERFLYELKRTCAEESRNKNISLQEQFAYATIEELIKDWEQTHPRKNYL